MTGRSPRPEDGQRTAFVLGTGRCGSTLVHEVLSRHRDVAFITNVSDRYRLGGRAERLAADLYRRLPPSATTKGRVRLAPSEGYRLLEREISPMLSDPSRDLGRGDATPWIAHRLRRSFAAVAEREGCDLLLHKFTGWPRVGLLDEVFEGARFIHVVRDGRAVANSWVQMPWWRGHHGPEGWHFGPLPPALAAEWESSGRSYTLLAGLAWKLLLDAFVAARDEIPEARWLEVRYEDIVDSPRESFARMLEFLGLPWTVGFERALGRHSFSSDRTAAFRGDLGPAASALLDESLRVHLRRLGYEVDDPALTTRDVEAPIDAGTVARPIDHRTGTGPLPNRVVGRASTP